jgi:DNA-binding NarL/FixJ family response regulator
LNSLTTCAAESLSILVVDDFEPFRYALCRLLEKVVGFTVVGQAVDGNSAIEMTFHLVPRIIIMDVKMPRLGGMEATRRIKRVLPDVHVVAVSTQDDIIIREAMMTAGCSAFVMKDCAHTLPAVIAKITGRHVANAFAS